MADKKPGPLAPYKKADRYLHEREWLQDVNWGKQGLEEVARHLDAVLRRSVYENIGLPFRQPVSSSDSEEEEMSNEDNV